MKLSNLKNIGRYMFENGKAVNIKQGRRMERGTDILFYLYRGKRVYVSDFEFSKMISVENK